ncbi:nicotinate-nucleotide--dimethylbenzimidazole phosphoribosyltransferase [Actinopolymorpha cephalotaxi]|uniref:Nicotinate-nucleotide--dimethylbenzimidazole phosphoribosyltransferase n=1 Tax=Actinopolymorpha cephalotaxi TaxID=504797 RepID=A0ABX2S5C0_9ACTN|nr:nicotinate-nucleotide--dimethylbenzimidazole phosphoribosyltransferase [Actinopolymorpha cephalotaxi]NYH84835.1 nicotinate-nucleotide--dimethylbenzimidazole phosphoribosyltransferase [Actinopolymorpha cephalotaxi]
MLDRTLRAVRPPDAGAVARARARHDALAKPRGALGVVEDLGAQLAGLAGTCPPPVPEPAGLAVFAGDHGVHRQGVSPWPQEITAAMVSTFLSGGAVVNALARQAGARVRVVDVGVAADLPPAPGLLDRKVRAGTDDLSERPAMSRTEAVAAVEVGIDVAADLVAQGCRCLLTGDMGIANTTPAAALVAAFTGGTPELVTGRGTGIDDATWATKVAVVGRALDLHRPDPADPLGVLAALGGLEHAATVGFLLGAAAARVPVVLDGIAAGAAALVARALAPDAVGAFVAGHVSAEPAARLALAELGLRPVLDLDLRLGEGSGAVLALPVVRAAAVVLSEVATLDEVAAGGADARSARRPRRILVLGGARSGKSTTAERLAGAGGPVTYLATGPRPTAGDPEWAERVRTHRERRPPDWTTVETSDLVAHLKADDPERTEPLLIDCLSTWLTGVMDAAGCFGTEHHSPGGPPGDEVRDPAAVLAAEVDALVAAWGSTTRTVVAVSNEVGGGVVPATSSGRLFRDELGVLNARIAAASDEVWLLTAGIPQRLR